MIQPMGRAPQASILRPGMARSCIAIFEDQRTENSAASDTRASQWPHAVVKGRKPEIALQTGPGPGPSPALISLKINHLMNGRAFRIETKINPARLPINSKPGAQWFHIQIEVPFGRARSPIPVHRPENRKTPVALLSSIFCG